MQGRGGHHGGGGGQTPNVEEGLGLCRLGTQAQAFALLLIQHALAAFAFALALALELRGGCARRSNRESLGRATFLRRHTKEKG